MNHTFWIVAGKRFDENTPKFVKGIGTAGIVFAFPQRDDAEAYRLSCHDANALGVFEMTAVAPAEPIGERPIEPTVAKD